ncbi:hypothetical protein BDW66DRAFT_103091 [Aspergillus desertorum]
MQPRGVQSVRGYTGTVLLASPSAGEARKCSHYPSTHWLRQGLLVSQKVYYFRSMPRGGSRRADQQWSAQHNATQRDTTQRKPWNENQENRKERKKKKRKKKHRMSRTQLVPFQSQPRSTVTIGTSRRRAP